MVLKLNRRPGREGVAAVEFALLLPLVLILLLGTWEIGRVVQITQILNNAAREGARQSTTGLTSGTQVQQIVLNYLQNAGIPTTHATVTVSDLTSPGTDPTNANQMDQLQVSVSIPFSDVRWTTLSLVTNSSTKLNGQATWYSLKDQNYPTSVTSPAGY